ncbi:MAG TPA: histidine kinase, partial [Solirubrobacteraceae bacterium]|nr:histidine kinase [Solirubrobacteraceae bacterium]
MPAWIRERTGQRLLDALAPESVSGAVARFALTGLLVVCLVGVGAGEVLRHVGMNEAVRDSQLLTQLAGEGIVAPAVTPQLLRQDPSALRAMDRLVDERVLRPPVVRVKLWDLDGRIVYSDDQRLIGRRFGMSRLERSSLETGKVTARVTELRGPEHRLDRELGPLMEVYAPLRAPSGERLIFETYQRYGAVTSSARDRWQSLLPVLLGALGLLALLQIPIAAAMARRLKRAERDRIALLERAIDAQHQERRRIAGDLHDGVVQSLAGISYQLAAAAEHVDQGTPRPVADALRSSALETRNNMRALRSLLVDIYPPSLEREGLTAALSDLRSRTAGPALDVRVHAPADMRLPPPTEALLFRAA